MENFLFKLSIMLVPALLAITCHEVSHGFIADRRGDGTARMMGRLTLNPLKHLDIFGTLMVFIVGIGWAKPVPVNFNNLRHPKRDMIWVAAAGPATNFVIAALSAIALLAAVPAQAQEREAMAAYMDEALSEVPGVRVLKRDERHTTRSFYRYMFAITPKEFGVEHDVLCAALDAEGVDRAVWAGLSIGGFLSMRAALRHPERVRALVLMNTDAGPESAFNAFKYAMLRLGLKTLGPGPIVPSLLPIFLGKTTRRDRPDLREQVARQFMAMRVPSIAEGVHTIVARDDIRGELGQIRCPTLVIAGEEDQPLPPERSEQIARRIPHAEMVVVPKCGHLSALEAPEAVSRELTSFLERLPGA